MNSQSVLWVVYQMTMRNKPEGMRAVCEQSEWDSMELARPGYHTLIQGGISSESEAEKLARAAQGDDQPTPRPKSRWAQNVAANN